MRLHVSSTALLMALGFGITACSDTSKSDTGDTRSTPTDATSTQTDTSPDLTDTGTDTVTTTTTGTADTADTADTGPTTSLPTTTDVRTLVMPSDPNILYLGRWDHSEPDAPWCGWQGCSVVVNFEGTGLQATLNPGSDTEFFRVIVDDDHHASTRLEVSPGRETYDLIEGLPYRAHKVKLVKETYIGEPTTFQRLGVAGLGLLPPPERPPLRMLFLGDQTLAGYSLEHERNDLSASVRGSHFGYAGIVSRSFDAEYHNISFGDATLSSMLDRLGRTDRDDEDSIWDPAEFQADVVVVHLGANDVGQIQDDIVSDYRALVDAMRERQPDAHIVLYNAWGWNEAEPAQYTESVVSFIGDEALSSIQFPWLFEQFHACEYDHGGMAVGLTEHLSEELGWDAETADVMSGFGVGGNVANGGFEEVAPFGGFGWRYNGAPEVVRVEDETQAWEGVALAHLSSGGSIHQPNPVGEQQLVTLNLWLRGTSESDEVTVTIDFRPGVFGAEPLAGHSETWSLTSVWQPYFVQTTAPANVEVSADVVQTRVTIQAGATSEVDVDGLDMVIIDVPITTTTTTTTPTTDTGMWTSDTGVVAFDSGFIIDTDSASEEDTSVPMGMDSGAGDSGPRAPFADSAVEPSPDDSGEEDSGYGADMTDSSFF